MSKLNWRDPDVWASWDECSWQPRDNPQQWACSLPVGHSGPHVAYLHMEASPMSESYAARDVQTQWSQGAVCYTCGMRHPGYRHSTHNDPVHIVEHDDGFESLWGPAPNKDFPDGAQIVMLGFIPTFFDIPFPTPPKFTSIEEAEAWLEANPP